MPELRYLIMAVASIAAILLYFRLRRRFPSGPKLTARQAMGLLGGMLVGSLIGGLAVRYAETLFFVATGDGPVPSAGILASMVGGWLGVEVAKGRLRITHPSGDSLVFPILLLMGMARLSQLRLLECAVMLIIGGFFVYRVLSYRQRGCMFSQAAFFLLLAGFAVGFSQGGYRLSFVPISSLQLVALLGMAHALMHWRDECCGRPVGVTAELSKDSSQFVELTNSLCATCMQKVEAKVLVESAGVYLQKFCPDHGLQRVLIADDVPYWREARALYKPPTSPLRRNAPMRRGCPYDCGICPDHEQHTCLAILEITEQCDMTCPICYAGCNPSMAHRPLELLESMLDSAVANEGKLNVVQVSGGEPTLHPDLFAILDAVRRRPVRHIMLNTNGKRIAEDAEFTRRLKGYLPGFEVYLQFDSSRAESLRAIRGQDLTELRRRALGALEREGISTTLVVTLVKGVNDGEVGEILALAAEHKCVRGVTFQPVQLAGRLAGVDPAGQRLTLTEVRRAILEQSKIFTPADIVPVPCHTDALAMGYALRRGTTLTPLSRIIDPRTLLNIGGNTICYEQDPRVHAEAMRLFSASASPGSAAESISGLCCEPGQLPGMLTYDRIFRVIIMQFMDAWNMDLRSLKRSCVHIIHPDGRLIPFETYNLMYRQGAGAKPPV